MSLALSSELPDRDAPGAIGPLVNLKELARRLSTTRQTLSVWLDKWPDFPVVQRGTNGLPYQFDATAVVAWLWTKKEAEARSTAARDEALAQLTLPFALEEEPIDGGRRLSIKDHIEALKLRKLQREEAERTGQLVQASEVADHISTCLIHLSRTLRGVARGVAQDHNLPGAVERAIADRLAAAQRQFVQEMTAQLGAGVADVA